MIVIAAIIITAGIVVSAIILANALTPPDSEVIKSETARIKALREELERSVENSGGK